MGHHMPCLPVEVELASQGVPYAMWAMQHYGAPHALLATFVSPKIIHQVAVLYHPRTS